ncbi:PQQ-binding-like beta-propeller repeat protein [Streptomyces actinomycinicus]|uniref:PQQ-binding-like beta-propeller repeat protein n=1 Tax=Streptomyces actinomycinicus TaxID=1695166 RepID=A0A937EP49_9ACTN|nr:serine/threonine-protein kinase [Streptomyces actinomycinicus]MBL1085580.1 PQQ-binding-like beta-propeller repeat protein [Streptomyces actinomycinicus]
MTPQRNTGAGAEAELPEYAGHYRLESCLGSGGMGVVHLARSTSGMKLAVKVVHAEFARDPEFRGRFRQEVAAARRVSGAFTAPVVDADPEGERPWMATLFIPGPTLSEQVKRKGPMPAAQLRRLMAGLAEALRDIHRVGVVHRDLKPSNVLLAEDGPKVIDFGISRPKDSELRTETGKLIGTPPFMAPEQFRRPREVGPAADVFALGSVMVHAATGRGPFDSDSPYVVAYQVVHDEPDLTGVPDSLAPLIRRCLAKEPEDRPTPDELMRELRSVAASFDTQAFIPAQRTAGDGPPPPAAGPGPAGRRPARRLGRGRLVLGAAALALALVGSLASVWAFGGDDSAPRRESGPARTVASGPWTARSVPAGEGMPQCAEGAGRLLCARPGVVFALSASDGRLLWRRSVHTRTTSGPPAVSGGLVQPYTDGGSRLAGLDPATGKDVWQRRLPTGTTVRYAGGTALLTDAGGVVTGVDGATGATRWRSTVPGQGGPSFTAFPGEAGGSAYATRTSADGKNTQVTAVDPGTGKAGWDVRLGGWLKPVAAGKDGSVYFLGVDSGYGAKEIVRYSPATGSTRRVALPAVLDGAHVAVRGDVAYVLATGGSLDAVDLGTGKHMWHLETSVSRGSAPVVQGGRVYFTASDGRLLAVDARTGRLVGQTPARLGANSAQVMSTPPAPLIVGSLVCATAPDGTVFAVDGRSPARW